MKKETQRFTHIILITREKRVHWKAWRLDIYFQSYCDYNFSKPLSFICLPSKERLCDCKVTRSPVSQMSVWFSISRKPSHANGCTRKTKCYEKQDWCLGNIHGFDYDGVRSRAPRRCQHTCIRLPCHLPLSLGHTRQWSSNCSPYSFPHHLCGPEGEDSLGSLTCCALISENSYPLEF